MKYFDVNRVEWEEKGVEAVVVEKSAIVHH